MAGPYADVALVKKMIRAVPTMETDEDVDARITALNKAVSLALEEACERTWGAPVADTTEIVWVGPGDTIVLPRPARSITSVTYGGTLTGSTMTGGTTVASSGLYHSIIDRNGLIYAIRSNTVNVWWWNWAWLTASNEPYPPKTPVAITGDFVSSDNDTTVPDDITYIASYMVVERLKVEKASAFGAVGPDGDVAPIRDVFNDPLVKRVIDKYRNELVWAV
jgi:hypothetical protein